MIERLTVTLRANPQSFAMAERKAFSLEIEVTNNTQETLDPQLDASELRIDGKPATFAWKNALLNRGRSGAWNALPPGESVGGRWVIGEQLFFAPGEYTLQLRVSDILSAPVQIKVSE